MQKVSKLQLKTLRVLYAEDEPKIRKPIADTLRFYVKEVIEAKDGHEALKLYKCKPPLKSYQFKRNNSYLNNTYSNIQ